MTAAVGYFWGDDGYGLERAAQALGARAAAAVGSDESLDRWRTTGAEATADTILERVATATMFGGGTLAVVSNPMPLIRSKAGLGAIAALLGAVAPGNALVFLDPMERMPPRSKGLDATRRGLESAILESGGEARSFGAPDYATMPRWIDDRARELGIRMGRGAAAELARRVGALARGGDIDRRSQGQLAVAELEKLSLLHVDGGEITPDDVAALVVETVPHSAFEFLDAFGERRTRQAAEQFDRLLQVAPEPVVVAQLYTRIRQLLEVTDRIAGGDDPRTVVREAKLNPYVAQKLAAMAPRWTVRELRRALEGLFALDVLVKGADGATSTEEGRRLAFTLWLAETLGGS